MEENESHRCQRGGCHNNVSYDDEPFCYEHSPDSGSSVPGYSFKKSLEASMNRKSQ